MDKGIRNGVMIEFNNMLPQLATIGGKAFRRHVLDWAVEQFGCTMAASSTHYNFAKHQATVADVTLTERLGRAPEKNNGGRKKREVAVEVAAAEFVDAESIVQTEFTVCKKADSSVVAQGVSFEEATALIAKNAAQKKAKLYWI